MIKSSVIQKSLSSLIRRAGIDWEITFDNEEELTKDIVYVSINERRETVDRVYIDRVLAVDIHLIPYMGENDKVDLSKLRDMGDSLQETLGITFPLADRHITIYETKTKVFDDILHFMFELEFTDNLKGTEENMDRMENLGLNILPQ